ncbi:MULTISPECIES: DEAD/DEAH box helicase [unclassified Pantoea]|uniref:DEAD/DEAH box helicase n=1 Tax=unclassified Pantoea TaxID=2630326 RepID=UPI001CD5125C|nr:MULTISPECIES: DEAD/DEAH box helicase family protein [unclassified Pantoea]MCA1175771.1 DEAD/DEAH box helicase family protein [Pantoea sp. alder69]MCA1253225.1 DEAD/DEAH box helicase family protein [Pantoea sp. alder70]MCA1263312.1 DEAD/DEAH box helicase family protein [Pantoea sp. alder81]
MSNDVKIANQISARLSLRNPQEKSLQILCDVLEQMGLSKDADLNRWIEILKPHYPSVKKFERAFPSLCFALATGVGKTRLMGAMITWLYLTGRSRHFFVLAPNLTIYEKLKKDFLMGSPKYVFQGIPELVQTPPIIITGDDYEDGRGVRLDYAVAETMTGDLFVGEDAPHINIFNISKINAKDNKIGANKSNDPKMRRLQEYIGDSYFNYLADLPDLVVIMDEAHRYYASAGAKALDDLKPVLGIELTATPKHVGSKQQEFTNIIYHYPLASALNDGYVKTPAVATRKEFKPSDYSHERLEEIKLEDGIHHHEYVKTELASYANNTGEKLIKPFMLVVAQDTSHAESLKKKIEADSFFEGAYTGKVITIHSNQTGEESEETTQRLLSVEHDKDTEIVIHVNKLKEGWDVTNLYTIVPLRASASEILTEQTIGRGLRLPYGKRTKVEAVDRLTIIAHDRFQEIIDQANDKESIIKKTLYIGPGEENDIPEKKPKQIFVPSMVDYALGNKPVYIDNSSVGDRQATYDVSGSSQVENCSSSNNVQTKEYTPAQKKIAELTVAIVQQEAKNLESSKQLTSEQVKQHIAQRVHQVAKELFVLNIDNDNKVAEGYTNSVGQATEQAEMFDSVSVDEIVSTVTETIAEFTIDIPKIVVLPTRDVNYGFNDFDLIGLEHISLKPQSNEILISNLETSQISTISWENVVVSEERLENYLVFYLMDHDEIDYDEHAGMLYKLSGQMVAHLKSYLSDVDTEGVLKSGGRILAEFIWSQIKQHMWTTPTDYVGSITQGFDVLKPTTFNFANDEEPRDFRAPIPAGQKNKVRQMILPANSGHETK